jgi:hypothetical protein
MSNAVLLGCFVVIIIATYGWLHDWWPGDYSNKLREQFAIEIKKRVSCLFSVYGGSIIPNTEKYPAAFDYAVVTIAIDNMLFRFIRGRMDFRVDVAPREKPSEWWEVSRVVKNAAASLDPGRKLDYYGLNDFGAFFETNIAVLRHELAKSDWKAPRGRLVPFP